MRMVFQEVATRASKSGICPHCGKRAVRNEKFYQTINPFNKTADGRVKDYHDIHAELAVTRAAWKAALRTASHETIRSKSATHTPSDSHRTSVSQTAGLASSATPTLCERRQKSGA